MNSEKNQMWKLTQLSSKKPKLNNPILIEGLPGIGNVGKIAVDFIIEELKAEKLYDLFSYTFPHSVFVNEDNLVELPMIEVYYKKFNNGNRDLLILAGDVQPLDEVSSYEFSDTILNLIKEYGGSEVITLGGIGLQSLPKEPKVFCTGSSKEIIKRYKKGVKINDNLYGVVGPIVGVSGLLLGLAKRKEMEGISLLAETYGHPMHLGMKEAKEIVKVLNTKLNLGLNIKNLDKEIKKVELELADNTTGGKKMSKEAALKSVQKNLYKDVSYIG